MSSSDSPPGILGSLRTLGGGLVSSLKDRVELISLELQEEKFRLIQTFVWICAAMFAGMMALVFVSLTLVYLFWDYARLAVLGGFAVFYTGGAIAIIIFFRRYLARQPRPFAATIEELTQDPACITKDH